MNPPLVSILIPSYKPKYFELTLKSAIGQSYENIEIIVSDDCPDNSIEKIVNRYISVAPICYQRNPNPDGLGTNNCINCMRVANGDYVKFLFDDDVLMPFAVQYMVEAFVNYQAINPSLVVSERWFIDSNNRYRGTNRFPAEGVVDISEFAGERYLATVMQNKLGEFSTAMWRRKDSFDSDGNPLFVKINGHDIGGLTDVAMWINLAYRGRVLYVALPLSCFRHHDDSNTANKVGKNHYKIYTDWEIIVDQALAKKIITVEEALASYKALALAYKNNEAVVTSLQGHSERLTRRISHM